MKFLLALHRNPIHLYRDEHGRHQNESKQPDAEMQDVSTYLRYTKTRQTQRHMKQKFPGAGIE